jgi:hypothetical protein
VASNGNFSFLLFPKMSPASATSFSQRLKRSRPLTHSATNSSPTDSSLTPRRSCPAYNISVRTAQKVTFLCCCLLLLPWKLVCDNVLLGNSCCTVVYFEVVVWQWLFMPQYLKLRQGRLLPHPSQINIHLMQVTECVTILAKDDE